MRSHHTRTSRARTRAPPGQGEGSLLENLREQEPHTTHVNALRVEGGRALLATDEGAAFRADEAPEHVDRAVTLHEARLEVVRTHDKGSGELRAPRSHTEVAGVVRHRAADTTQHTALQEAQQ